MAKDCLIAWCLQGNLNRRPQVCNDGHHCLNAVFQLRLDLQRHTLWPNPNTMCRRHEVRRDKSNARVSHKCLMITRSAFKKIHLAQKIGDEKIGWPLIQVIWLTYLLHDTLMHDDHTITNRQRFFLIMCHKDSG